MNLLAKVALVSALGAAVFAAPSLSSPTGPTSSGAMMSQVSEIQQQILGDYRYVQHLQVVARKERDVIKLNCVNDKLVQMKPEMNIADRARSELLVESTGNQRTSFEMVVKAGEQVHLLREGAESCIGQPLLSTESSNTFTHPQIPDDPNGNTFGGQLEPPAYASPFN